MKLYISRRLIVRYEYIETQLLWGDGITANELAKTFDISRQAAQEVINGYRSRYPSQMYYDSKQKRHRATEIFEPQFIKKNPMYFLDYLRGQSLLGFYREGDDWSNLVITDIDRLFRPEIHPEAIQTIIIAIQRKNVIMMDYFKKDLAMGEPTVRIVSPNHIVFADNRYHLRAYCHTRNEYRDFVLSRIVQAEIVEGDWVSSKQDKEWNEFITLRFKPNPELPESVRNAIINNYEKEESAVWVIRCKIALAFYVERKLLSVDEKYGIPAWIRY